MFDRNKFLLIIIVCVVIAILVGYFYISTSYLPVYSSQNSVKTPQASEVTSQLTQVVNKTEEKGLKIILSSVENILPDMETVVLDGERITQINLVAFSKDDISQIDFCKYTYEIYLNGADKKDYQSCSTKKINNHTILVSLKTNIRASPSSYLSIYPLGEPPVLGIDELRIG